MWQKYYDRDKFWFLQYLEKKNKKRKYRKIRKNK